MEQPKLSLYIIEEERVTPHNGEQTIMTIFTDPSEAHQTFLDEAEEARSLYGNDYDDDFDDEEDDDYFEDDEDDFDNDEDDEDDEDDGESSHIDIEDVEVELMTAENFTSQYDSAGGDEESRSSFSLFERKLDISEENLVRFIQSNSSLFSQDTKKKLIELLS